MEVRPLLSFHEDSVNALQIDFRERDGVRKAKAGEHFRMNFAEDAEAGDRASTEIGVQRNDGDESSGDTALRDASGELELSVRCIRDPDVALQPRNLRARHPLIEEPLHLAVARGIHGRHHVPFHDGLKVARRGRLAVVGF